MSTGAGVSRRPPGPGRFREQVAVTYSARSGPGCPGHGEGPSTPRSAGRGRVDVTRDGALRRIAAAVSGRTELASLFDDVIDYTVSLFSVERAALWLLDDTVPPVPPGRPPRPEPGDPRGGRPA